MGDDDDAAQSRIDPRTTVAEAMTLVIRARAVDTGARAEQFPSA